ncbi:MAG: dihydrolipoamide acetyltransferase family protein [Pseudoclavibacter sp.]
MAPTIITMPAVVADATDAVLQAWLVAEGDAVTPGTPIADIETEKATVEFEAESTGTIGRFIVEPGARVAVGDPVAVLLAEGEGPVQLEAALAEAGAAAAGGDAETVPDAADDTSADTAGGAGDSAAAGAAAANADAAADTSIDAAVDTGAAANGGERLFASPLARKIARESGVELTDLAGTGPGGRIVRADVLRAIDATPEAVAAPAPDAPGAPSASGAVSAPAASGHDAGTSFTDTPMTPMRRAIARRLTESKTQVPHFYVTRAMEVDALLALRKDINAAIGDGGRRVSVNDLVIKAVACALVDVPAANSIVVGESIRSFETVDIAVAIAVPDGLLTPLIRGVESMSVGAISRQMGDFVERAKAGRIKQRELEGGAFSVSNLGMYGVDDFSAILNPPQSGILAVSAAKTQPVVRDGAIEVASVMNVTLSADHRVIDGAVAAEFVGALAARIEAPFSLLV